MKRKGSPIVRLLGRRRREIFVWALLIADAAVVASALPAADYARFHLGVAGSPIPHAAHADLARPALLAAAAFAAALWGVGLYGAGRGARAAEQTFRAAIASGAGLALFLALSYLFKEVHHSRLMLWAFAVLAFAGIACVRLGARRALRWLHQRGWAVHRIVVVGDSPAARSLASRIQRSPQNGLRVVGHLLASRGAGRGNGDGLARLEDAFGALREARPHAVLFAESISGREEMTYLLARCQEEGIAVWIGTDVHERYSPRMELREIESIPVIVLGRLRLERWEALLKRSVDVVLAALALLIAAPFLLYAALRIRRETGEQAIFRQARVGFQGRPFTILKLRAPDRGSEFCAWLRRYSLDEILQCWNVLRGEMSLVGPRPERAERVRRYSPWNRRRLQVKPGITGLAQIAGVRGEDDFEVKSRFDVTYLENQSFLLDLRILLRTPLAVWRRRGGGGPAGPRAAEAAAWGALFAGAWPAGGPPEAPC